MRRNNGLMNVCLFKWTTFLVFSGGVLPDANLPGDAPPRSMLLVDGNVAVNAMAVLLSAGLECRVSFEPE